MCEDVFFFVIPSPSHLNTAFFQTDFKLDVDTRLYCNLGVSAILSISYLFFFFFFFLFQSHKHTAVNTSEQKKKRVN